jgi:hypothetical protein
MTQPIYTGTWGRCHIQGIAVDKKNGYIYYSFTTKLVKATLDGEIIGSVDGLIGHLGCIAFCEADGRVYGSLEYKNDSIGRGIQSTIKDATVFDDGFYIARFDVDKIDRLDMSAEESGVMKCIYLKEVVDDYNGTGKDKDKNTVPHRYGCSGIDGVTFGPLPGKSESDGVYLFVAYGIYRDLNRCDNDHQVILCYDTKNWDTYAKEMNQRSMHVCGPDAPDHKFFVYTGNTTWGVQNLEYDRHTSAFFMAVYNGTKPEFPNYGLYAIDASVAPKMQRLCGLDEDGETLTLKPIGNRDEATGVYGWHFPHGSTGMFSYGDGRWLISENRITTEGQCGYIFHYLWNEKDPFITIG